MERLIHVLLISGLCLFTQSISPEYVLVQQQKGWDEAQIYCKQNHFDLATVQSNEDWIYLQERVEHALTSLVWIGLYNDIYSWRWSYQDENITFLFWKEGEPNNPDGKQECAFIDSVGWCDRPCTDHYPLFCYNEAETGASRFVFISDINRTWHEGQSYCRQHHTDLATIQSQTENDQLTQRMQSHNRAWIGLFRDSWKWSDGTNVSTSPIRWLTSTRDVTGQNRPCGAVGPDGLIDDRLCSDALPFICEILTRKQVVRVEVKSDQNLNDAAVMEIILHWIKQKLKDHGIEKDTVLTWRLQPDGKVFSPKHDNEDPTQEAC